MSYPVTGLVPIALRTAKTPYDGKYSTKVGSFQSNLEHPSQKMDQNFGIVIEEKKPI